MVSPFAPQHATDAARVNLSPASALTSTETLDRLSIAPTHATAPGTPFEPGRAGNVPPTAQASRTDDVVSPAFSKRSDETPDHVSPPSRDAAACGDASSSSPTRKCR